MSENVLKLLPCLIGGPFGLAIGAYIFGDGVEEWGQCAYYLVAGLLWAAWILQAKQPMTSQIEREKR